MLTFSDIALGGLLPGLLSLLIAALAWPVWRRTTPAGSAHDPVTPAPPPTGSAPSAPSAPLPAPSSLSTSWPGALAVALAYIVAQVAMRGRSATGWSLAAGWPSLPPHTVDGWLVYGAKLFVGAAAVALDAMRFPSAVRTALMALLIAAAAWLQAGTAVMTRWKESGSDAGAAHATAIEIAAGAVLGSVALWLLVNALARRRGAARQGMVLFMVAMAGAIVLASSGSLELGQFSGALSAAAAGTAIAAALSPVVRSSRGMVAVFCVVFAQLLLRGYLGFDPLGSGLTLPCLALLAVAPLLTALAALPPLRKWRAWKVVLIEVIIVAIPLAIAAVLAMREATQGNGE